MNNKFLILLSLATLTSCAVDPQDDHSDPVLDDARQPVYLTHCLDQPAPPADTSSSHTFKPAFQDIGGFGTVDEPVGIVSLGRSIRPALTVLNIPTGTRVTGISWSACGNGYADAVAAVWVARSFADLVAGPSGVTVHHGSQLDNNHSGQWSTLSVQGFVPFTKGPSDVVGLFFTPYDGPDYVIGTVTVTN